MQEPEIKFEAFGKQFSRDQAENLIYLNMKRELHGMRDEDTLQSIIFNAGWKPIDKMTSKELQEWLTIVDETVDGDINELLSLEGVQL